MGGVHPLRFKIGYQARRGALRAPDTGASDTVPYEAPVGQVEETLARIWADVLQVPRVGRRDHFFQLGGHSLLAVKVASQMRREGLLVDVSAMFTRPTLADLASQTKEMTEVLL